MGLFHAHGVCKLVEDVLVFEVFSDAQKAFLPAVVFVKVNHHFGDVFNTHETVAAVGIKRHAFEEHVIQLVGAGNAVAIAQDDAGVDHGNLKSFFAAAPNFLFCEVFADGVLAIEVAFYPICFFGDGGFIFRSADSRYGAGVHEFGYLVF